MGYGAVQWRLKRILFFSSVNCSREGHGYAPFETLSRIELIFSSTLILPAGVSIPKYPRSFSVIVSSASPSIEHASKESQSELRCSSASHLDTRETSHCEDGGFLNPFLSESLCDGDFRELAARRRIESGVMDRKLFFSEAYLKGLR